MQEPAAAADDDISLADELHRACVKAQVFGGAPPRLGRYTLLRRLGQGGLGVVFSARDDELDRAVAIKLLRSARVEHPGSDAPRRRDRLRSEARAMARLSHGNVVHVYEVGEHDGRIYLVMEFVRGETLGRWQVDRGTREITEMYIQAGLGLAAAHRAGVVHRDFKPANVLVDARGRARVCDFGLARVRQRAQPDGAPDRVTGAFGALGAPSTWQGTPAYMSPEQARNEAVTERSDQFSFCVALYQALSGARLDPASDHRAEVERLRGGGRAPSGRAVPAHVWVALARGLAPAASERFASMEELLAALSDEPARRRRRARRRALAVGVALLCVVGVLVVRDARRRACASAGASIEAEWGGARRAALIDAFRRTGVPYAEGSAARVVARLDEYTETWTIEQVEACLDAWHDALPRRLTDARARCLERRRGELAALVDALTAGGQATVERSLTALGQLTPVSRCAGVDELEREARLEELEREAGPQVQAARQQLARAQAFLRVGEDARAREELERGLASLASGDAPRTRAAAELLRGQLLVRDPLRSDEAARALAGAYTRAEALGDDRAKIAAASSLVYVLIEVLGRADEGRRGGELGEAAAERAGASVDRERAQLHDSLGSALRWLGQYEEARAQLERAVELEDAALDPLHPELAGSLSHLGRVLGHLGQHERALAVHERALEIYRRSFGEEHPRYAQALTYAARVDEERGRYDEATARYQQALAIWARAYGDAHTRLIWPHNCLGRVAMRAGRREASREHYERALALAERALGPTHDDVAWALRNLAEMHLAFGEYALAERHLRRGVDIWERAHDSSHHYLAFAWTGIGEAELGLGRPAEALVSLERARSLQTPDTSAAKDRGRTLFAIARAHAALGVGVEAERALSQAIAAFGAAGESSAQDYARALAWRDEQRRL
ncbi:MAG: serine/threonine protein kinase [Myxococcales bacterium]|nr:serine/threonine protein kinase [Myxococcales bacterium]